MKLLKKMHHVAVICSDYETSKKFYTKILGFEIKNEVYRKERDSFKLDLLLNGEYVIELFSFPTPPKRVSRPEATGLRHIAFEVDDIQSAIVQLKKNNIAYEAIRTDEYTNKRFTFISDPDGLPIELYEK
ncbi:MAG: VOC family protein [Bacteroidia bacterium]|nr:VOC family protein [Bacteroidia bacterium]